MKSVALDRFQQINRHAHSFGTQQIKQQSWVNLGFCPFGIVSIRNGYAIEMLFIQVHVHSGSYPFGLVSI